MADLFQIVSLDKFTGRKTVIYPITNDTARSGGGSRYEVVRDTFKATPPKSNQIISASDRRFGGGRVVGETHENGTVEMELYVNAGTTPDASIAAAETLTAQLQSASRDRYLEWRQEGATRSTYFELRGPGPWDNMYKWIEFQANRTVHMKAAFQTAPLARGDSLNIYDTFETDTRVSDWSYQSGLSTYWTYQTTGGSNVWSGANSWLWAGGGATITAINTSRGYKYGDVQVGQQFIIGATPTGGSSSTYFSDVVWQQDANNFFSGRLTWTGTAYNLRIVKTTGGSGANAAISGANLTLTPGARYWLITRTEGDTITAELWDAVPYPGGTPLSSVSYTLTTAESTQFGVGNPSGGSVGYTATNLTTGWTMEAFRAEAYTYSNVKYPATIDLNVGIPGTAPALVDVTVARASAGPWAVLGWLARSSRISAEVGTPRTPFGVLPLAYAAFTSPSGAGLGGSAFVSTADTNTRDGTAAVAPINASQTYSWNWPVQPGRLTPDDFQDTIMLEVYVRVRLDSTLVYPRLFPALRGAGVNAGLPPIYPMEFGALGRPVQNTPIAGASGAWRVIRAGTFVVPSELAGQDYNLSFDLTFAAGSTGNFGVDWALVVPSKQRAVGATGKTHDGTYPDFFRSAGLIQRLQSDLRAWAYHSDASSFALSASSRVLPQIGPSAGLGGQLLEVAPGPVAVTLYGSTEVPDDPSANANSETSVFGYVTPQSLVQINVLPRYFLGRS